MRICDGKTDTTRAEHPKSGHLYRRNLGSFEGQIHLCSNQNELVFIKDGSVWSKGAGFGSKGTDAWDDVTDQYCLKKEDT